MISKSGGTRGFVPPQRAPFQGVGVGARKTPQEGPPGVAPGAHRAGGVIVWRGAYSYPPIGKKKPGTGPGLSWGVGRSVGSVVAFTVRPAVD